jgi:predicted MPP superfamily phosphohydrolase
MKTSISIHWIGAVLYITTALVLFLILLNRKLLILRASVLKKPLIALFLVIFLTASGILGYLVADSYLLVLPAFILAGIFLGEVRRQVLRRRYRGSPPITGGNSKVPLSQPFTTTDLHVLHYKIECPQLYENEFTVIHLSDLHITNELPFDYYLSVMVRVNDLQPDFIFFTGDFVTKTEFIPYLPDILKVPKSRFGSFAVLGNHDYWSDPKEIAKAIRSSGIILLDNDHQRITINGRNDVVLCGYDTPWNKSEFRIPVLNKGDIALALSHIADNIYELSQHGVNAVFAGHNHGGQIRIPLLGPIIVPSKYGRRFDHGHFIVNKTHLFVTAGVGATKPAFRIYCQPDIFVIKFVGNQMPGQG